MSNEDLFKGLSSFGVTMAISAATRAIAEKKYVGLLEQETDLAPAAAQAPKAESPKRRRRPEGQAQANGTETNHAVAEPPQASGIMSDDEGEGQVVFEETVTRIVRQRMVTSSKAKVRPKRIPCVPKISTIKMEGGRRDRCPSIGRGA